MSLCPFYCECEPCKHGVATCAMECSDCEKEAKRRDDQRRHIESVARQKAKLKVMPREEAIQ